ncbi:hypothetical protein Gotur_026336, partial [Gossypium turneri]
MLSAVEERVEKLEESMEDAKELGNALGESIEDLRGQSRDFVEQRGVQKLSEAMTVVESVVKLGLGKDKFESSKFEERGVCEMDHNEDIVDGNDNGDNGGNRKPR